MKNILLLSICFLTVFTAIGQTGIPILQGSIINKNTVFSKNTYTFKSNSDLKSSILVVIGNNIVLDFSDATLVGSLNSKNPEQFEGLGILIKNSKNVTLKNLSIKGYKVALKIENSDSVQVQNCDFSYNYRPKLFSTFEKNDIRDTLSFEKNEKNEWFSFGCGVYIQDARAISIKDCKIKQGFNGVLIHNSSNCLVMNNEIQFNSGVGVGLYRSSVNDVVHNKLDWTARKQNAAGILIFEQSSNNTIARNSATHCDKGIWLWAGQETLDTGLGGSNGNYIYENDCSYAFQNGIEASFSANNIVRNKANFCNRGIVSSYCSASVFWSNELKNNQLCAIDMEQPMENIIRNNTFSQNKIGIKISTRTTQPNFIFIEKKPIDFGLVRVMQNNISGEPNPFYIDGVQNVFISGNILKSFGNLGVLKRENKGFQFEKNIIYQDTAWGDFAQFNKPMQNMVSKGGNWSFPLNEFGIDPYVPKFIPEGGKSTQLSDNQIIGRDNILVNAYGAYNFEYPIIVLKKQNGMDLTFEILGQKGEFWQIETHNLAEVEMQRGTFPAILNAKAKDKTTPFGIKLVYVGKEFVTQFGEKIAKGTTFEFQL